MEQAAATGFANQVMGRLFSEIDDKIKKLKGVRRQSESLRRELNILIASKIDELTHCRDAPRPAVEREHGEQIRELIHDMEDCIERFLHRITCKKEAGFAGRLRQAVHMVKTLGIRSRFAKEMEELKHRLQSLAGGRGLPQATAEPSAARHLPMEESPVGIAMAKQDLLGLLDEVEGEPKQLRVISIVGFGGSGKTTLANAVYKSTAAAANTKEGFSLRAWVRRSHYRDASGLLRKIIKEFWGASAEADTKELDDWDLQQYLQDNLQEQRYLIVLVDMDMTQYWKWIKLTFKNKGKSSRIIVTTSMLSLAKECSNGDGFVHQMRNLGRESSEMIALGNQQTAGDPASRKALVDKCDGHPLALVSVASHISSRIINCTELCDRLGSFLHTVPRNGADHFAELRDVLINNYTSLCYRTAQPSLLYLGIFLNDCRNLPKKKKITRRWTAEGYARSNNPRVSEQEEAEEIFLAFIDKNIIQPVGASNSTCKALGIVHEFVVEKSISDNFIMPFNAPESRTDGALSHEEKVRHLFVNDGNAVASSGSTLSMDLSRVRSLTVLSESAGGAFSKFCKYRLMRVLDLENCNEVNHRHLRKICKLWNLRYLSLSNNIKKLPKTIAHLKLLETLTVSKTGITELPFEVLRMPCLIHLSGKFMLPSKELPREDLERLCEGNKLQTLAGFIAVRNAGFLQLMQHSKNLRKVKIWYESTGEVRDDDIHSLDNADLVKAILEYSKASLAYGGGRSLSIDSQGPLPLSGTTVCHHLKSLRLHGNMSTVPRFDTFLSVEKLKKLCLSLTDALTLEILSAINGMHNLEHLKLTAAMVTEGLIVEVGEFKRLKCLCFVITRPDVGVPSMQVQQGYLPELVSLQLLSEHLTGSSGIEIRHLPKLQDVELHPRVSEPARQEWEAAARNHPKRPNILPFRPVDDPPVATVAPENPVANDATNVESASATSSGNEPAEDVALEQTQNNPFTGATRVEDGELTESPTASAAAPEIQSSGTAKVEHELIENQVARDTPGGNVPVENSVASTMPAGDVAAMGQKENPVSGAARAGDQTIGNNQVYLSLGQKEMCNSWPRKR